MRFRGVHHVEFSVLDYEKSLVFYDQLFGWLGYKSFWTLDIGYRSVYYMARFPFFHSYIGIQPAKTGHKLHSKEHATGIHHLALWAKNRKEIDTFYREFLLKNEIEVTDLPSEYPAYTPGYYAVFFNDPYTGIHFELAHTPLIPSIASILRWRKALKTEWKHHPEWQYSPWKEAMRTLPSRKSQREKFKEGVR